MPKHRIIHVVGNRPQFIKLAVLYSAIAKQTTLKQVVIHTGQHSSEMMSQVFFEKLSIPDPDVQLNLKSATPDIFIGNAASRISALLAGGADKDFVFVYGDTNSTLAAALAARRNGRKLLHFESGVRTQDENMPEEINRILTDRVSSVHYCCTEKNRQNLLHEGYGTAIPSEVILTGDLMLDAFLNIEPSAENITSSGNYAACTIHRAGNISNRKNLKEIVAALNKIHREIEVIIPLHPHTHQKLREFEIDLKCTVIKPLSYQQMKRFLLDANFVITDSGGACREAFFAKKKSLIIMEFPFWPEIIEAGGALNCKPDRNEIELAFRQLPSLPLLFDMNIFGDGTASLRIANHLKSITSNQ